jgi:hypothetical protein
VTPVELGNPSLLKNRMSKLLRSIGPSPSVYVIDGKDLLEYGANFINVVKTLEVFQKWAGGRYHPSMIVRRQIKYFLIKMN